MLGLFFLFIGAARPQASRDGSQQNQPTHSGQSDVTTIKPSPPSTQVQTGASEREQRPGPKSPGYPWGELLAPANIPSWCLFFVGLWAGGMAYWTLRNIENQTEQLRIQATLTREQVDVMVHKDQARLNLDPQPLTIEGAEGFFYLSAKIELTNLGESKAYVTFAAGRLAVVPSGQWPLPQPTPDESFIDFAKTISPSGDPIYFPLDFEDTPLDFGLFLEQINNGTLTVYLYGFIEWETLGIRRCRNFGYTWKTDDPDGVRTAGRIITEGWWERDVRQKNGDENQKPN